MQCYKHRKYFKKKQELWKPCKKTIIFFCLVTGWRFQHFRFLLQNPVPKLVTSFFFSPEITHWTYTCINLLALNKSKRSKNAEFFFKILVQYPRNWRKHLCVCVQLLENLQKTCNFFKRLWIGNFCLHMSLC